MAYSPLQPRGRDGKWVAKVGNSVVRRAVKGRRVRKSTPSANSSIRRGRGSGVKGLKQNAVPYVRVNKRSQTVGVNAGTIIPGTKKRIVLGGYARLESTTKTTGVDKAITAGSKKVLGTGTKRSKIVGAVTKRVSIATPAVRASAGGAQVRLGTSRMAGPTVIVRRGKHKTPSSKSSAGVAKYQSRMNTIAGTKAKKPRPQRRKK